jgi:hypothetical protein
MLIITYYLYIINIKNGWSVEYSEADESKGVIV